jgi:phenylalanyl-tRNA synthetase beta chain
MLFLKSWLQDYVDLSGISDKTLVDTISLKSCEVDEIIKISDWFDGKVLVGKITNSRQHPDADRLKIFDVTLGNNTEGETNKVQIVSAAPNVKDGLIVPIAMVGASINGIILAPRKMRGVESFGMCCGQSELNLETENSAGLWELNDLVKDTDLGKSICSVLPQYFPSQTIFDISILPDKISKLGFHLSMAIEIARIFNLNFTTHLKGMAKELTESQFPILSDLFSNKDTSELNFEDKIGYTKSFSLFKLTLEKQFELDCIKRMRMQLLGENLTGGIADLSNYFMLDLGQPTHFFRALDSVTGSKLKIEDGSEEDFEGLGQLKKTKLQSDIIKLKLGGETIAIPGVSGGAKSAVIKTDTESQNLWLEVASFESELVAKNCFKLNYRSSASKLYCGGGNGVDSFLSTLAISSIFKELESLFSNKPEILTLSFGGKNVDWENFVQQITKDRQNTIQIDYNLIKSRLGKNISNLEINNILEKFGKIDNDYLQPFPGISLLESQEDLLREVSRLYGYDNLDKTPIVSISDRIADNNYSSLINLKRFVTNFGFYEVATRPFINGKYIKYNDKVESLLQLEQPYREGLEFLKDSLDISILEVLNKNLLDGHKDVKVFEITSLYTEEVEEKNRLNERLVLAGGLIDTGSDVYIITSLINMFFDKTNQKISKTDIVEVKIGSQTNYFLETGKKIARITEVANKVKKDFGLPINKRIFLFEIELSKELSFSNQNSYKDESLYPSISRSYNLYPSDHNLSTKHIVVQIEKLAQSCKVRVDIIPIEILEGKLTLSVKYVSYFKTLTISDILSIEEYLESLSKKPEII